MKALEAQNRLLTDDALMLCDELEESIKSFVDPKAHKSQGREARSQNKELDSVVGGIIEGVRNTALEGELKAILKRLNGHVAQCTVHSDHHHSEKSEEAHERQEGQGGEGFRRSRSAP